MDSTSDTIDRRSYILGMMTAFSEVLVYETKKMALSPPLRPEDYRMVKDEAERMAREQGIFLYLEENTDIPEENRLVWFIMYKFPEVLEEYKALRLRGLNPAWDFEAFFDLLSYGMVWGDGADKVVPRIREKRNHGGLDTMSRFLFRPGEWPPPKG
jgi:hypothetical protein